MFMSWCKNDQCYHLLKWPICLGLSVTNLHNNITLIKIAADIVKY